MTRHSHALPALLETATRGLMYTLVFLLPLWFVPLTFDVLEVNKQVLFLVLTFTAALTWSGSMLFAKQFRVQRGWMNLLPLLLLGTVAISAFFSSAPYLSWVGSSMQEYTSVLSFFGFVTFFYLLVNAFRDRATHRTLHTVLLVSALLTGLVATGSLFGWFSFSFAAEQGRFNTIGMINAVGVFLSVLSVFGASLFISHRRDDALLHQNAKGWLERVIIIALWVTTLVYVLALDYWVIWAIFLFGMTSLFIFGFFRAKDFERQGRLWMPSLSILLAIAFLVWFPSPFSLSVPAEVAPSIQASTQITQAVLKEAPLWGTGPGTYVFNYSLYHGPEVNSTDFWNTRFDRATSYVQTLLPTVGIVGASVFALFVIALFIRSIVQMLRPRSREDWLQAFVFFSPWLTLVFAAWLYSFNFTLMALFFTLAGLLGSQVIRKPYTKSYDASPGLALLFSTVLVGGSVLLFVGIFIASERYVGELAFARALRMDASNGSLQEVVSLLDTASTLNRFDDRYYRTLSEALLLRVNEQLTSVPNTAQLTAESRQYIQALVAASVNAAVHATELSPQNALNWDTRGRVYRELVTLVPEASQFAVVAHLTGTQLEPLSPRVWNELGKTYLVAVEHERALSVAEDPATAKAAQARLEENLKQAEQAFGRAIQLKPNYAPAHFQLGLTYERQGRTDDAIGKLASVLTFNKEDVGVAFELGQLYLSRDQAGDLALAQTQFEHAVELAPAFSNARWFLASVYERTGETTKAIEQIEQVAKLNPDNELVKTRLSRLLKGDKNTEPVAPIE